MPFFEVDKDHESIQAICFSHGTLKDQDKGNLKIKCFKQTKQSTSGETDRCLVRADINSMSYIGTNYGDTNRFPVNTCDYYIAVYNKRNNKVRVIPTNILQLDPWLEDKPLTDEVDTAVSTFREKKDALTREFGSGRNQRAVNKRLKNALDDEMISATTKTIVKVSAPQIEADESAVTEPLKNEMSTIPPYDKDAQIPEDVYKLKDIIPPEILPSLTQFSEIFYNCKQNDVVQWRTEKKYFTTVLDNLDRLSVREEPRLLQCQCLLYLQYLMETFLMKAVKLRSRYPLPPEWPIPVKDHILKMFTLEIKESSKAIKRCVPTRMKDLLLSYIIVLCLTLSNYTLPLDSLVKDLQLAQKRLSVHATTLGCTIKRAKSQKGESNVLAVLNVPLKFPEIKGKSEKKRIF